MSLDCGAQLAKYLLCLFNFIFFLGGFVVLGVGIWLAVDQTSFFLLTKISDNKSLQQFNQPSVIEQGAYVLIAAGAFVFIISFLGYCGAIKESRLLLVAYAVFLFIIIAMEIAVGVLGAIYKEETRKELRKFMDTSLEKYSPKSQATTVTISWDYLMFELSCCGVTGNPTDFERATHWIANRTTGYQVPAACCKLVDNPGDFQPQDPDCPKSPLNNRDFHKDGCYDKLLAWVERHLNIMIAAGIGLGVVELLGIVFACCLCKAIGNMDDDDDEYK